MALEDLTGTKYIDALVSTNPPGTDGLDETDDHIRGIKNVLLKTFPNLTGAVTATQTELNKLDGVTASAAELNITDGLTATTAELNKMDGVTASTAELNILDGVTSTTAELNILDGVTATAAELNILDGVLASAAELNILNGVTATTAEINKLDGVTATTANLNKTTKAVAVMATGSYTGNGTTSQSVTGVGFQPKYVKIWVRNTGSGFEDMTSWETTDTIVDDNASGMAVQHPPTGGVYHQSSPNRIISLNADGFTVDDGTTDAHPNMSGQVYNYLAMGVA